MRTSPSHQFDDRDLDAPERLKADLVALFAPTVAVPAAVDEAVLANARRQMARARRMRVLLRWGGGAAAVAATLLVAIRLVPHHPMAPGPSARVTILDAFSLARQLKAGGKVDRSWDANGDGVIDQRDVDALAARAVSLSGSTTGGRQ